MKINANGERVLEMDWVGIVSAQRALATGKDHQNRPPVLDCSAWTTAFREENGELVLYKEDF